MFRKFIKNTCIALMLLSYATTALPMQQPQSWWQKVKSWVKPANQQNKVESNQAQNTSLTVGTCIRYGLGFPLLATLCNFCHVGSSLLTLYNCFILNKSQLPSISNIDSSEFSLSKLAISKEKIIYFKNMLLSMGVPPETKIAILGNNREQSSAAATRGLLLINPTLFSGLDLDEQAGILAHEGSHIINNDALKGALFKLGVSAVTFGILAGYYYGSKKITKKLKKQYPAWRESLGWINFCNRCIILNPVFSHLIVGYLWSSYSCMHEARADLDGASVAGSVGLIKHLKKCQNEEGNTREIIEKMNIIEKLILKIVLLLNGNPRHPSHENRIKALEALPQNILNK